MASSLLNRKISRCILLKELLTCVSVLGSSTSVKLKEQSLSFYLWFFSSKLNQKTLDWQAI